MSTPQRVGESCDELDTQPTVLIQENRRFSIKNIIDEEIYNIQNEKNDHTNNKCISCPPRCVKILWLIIAISVIGLAVILVISPLVLSKIPPQGVPTTNNSLWGITTELTLLRYYGLEVTEVNCSYEFEFNNYLCLPQCNWHPAGNIAFLMQYSILIIIDVTGIILSIISISAWIVPFIRYAYHNRHNSLSGIDINLPRLTLFMLLLSVAILILLYAILDIPQHEDIFCKSVQSELGFDFSLVSLHSDARIEVYGALFHYFTLSYLLWTVCSWLNILLVLCFPLQITTNFKVKNTIFLTELLISILVPFFAIFLAVQGPDYNGEYTAAYGPVQIYRTIFLIDHSLYGTLYEWPHFISLGIILAFNVIIVFKLKMKLLKQTVSSGRKQSIGGFETRFMVHSVILIILHIFVNATVIAYKFIEYRYFWQLEEIIGCVTLNSNLTFTLEGNVYTSKSLELVKIFFTEYSAIEINSCQDYFLDNEMIYPSFLFILSTILLRLVWLSVFVVLIPQFSPGRLYKSIRSHTKIQTQKSNVV
ncbi:hypothetical protein LOD99_11641 [Oopsacas minuta]|uniref:Uncharacterized protein n=1 Tax=Oopsacas minuta TaxID=111878 RepID=A0AAV7JK83_9METZ|nr:hypothetical protein LOD99_11641 [Oopsacas minuta]